MDSEWNHITIIYDGKKRKIYLNGRKWRPLKDTNIGDITGW